MRSTLRRIVFFGSLFAVLAFTVILLNQTLQLAQLAERVDPRLGAAVLWGVLLLFAVSLLVPAALFLRLPRPLLPPKSEEPEEVEQHLERLRRRLARHPALSGQPLATHSDVEAALAVLDEKAIEVVRTAGRRAFLTTAISQNGALDALFVLGIQAKLIWDVSHAYAQRPALREMTYLYANVLTTAFLAGEIDDIDLSQAIQPALSAVFGSAAGAVPGLQVASTVFVNSVVSGTANAYLTLRVGIIAQEYSRALVRPKKASLRRAAAVRAGGLLGGIAVAGAAKVSSAIARASGRTVSSAIGGVGRRVRRSGSALRERLWFRRAETEEE